MRLLEITTRIVARLVSIFATGLACAQGITVQAGASLSVGNGQIDLGFGDLQAAGKVFINSGALTGIRDVNIAGGSGTISLARDWSNSGIFTAGTGKPWMGDECAAGSSLIACDSTFNDFSDSSVSGKLLGIQSGSNRALANSLSLQRVEGNPLQIGSGGPGQQAFCSLDSGGT